MKLSLCSLGALLLAGGLAAVASGCRVEAATAKKYVAEENVTRSQDWASGNSVEVNGIYGDIIVRQGDAGRVRAIFTPFNYGAYDEETEARNELDANIQLVMEANSAGDITISTGRSAGPNGIGSDIVVELPPDFDSALDVRNRSNGPINPGNIRVNFVGSATAVTVRTAELGDCTVQGAPTVTRTVADCDGTVEILSVSDDLDVTSTFLETGRSVNISLASISENATGGSIRADDGNIRMTFPASANFSVMCQTEEGVVNEGDLPEACSVQEAEARSKTVTCGSGGPVYEVSACLDGVGDCNIGLAYR
jgi:hypothetical protein